MIILHAPVDIARQMEIISKAQTELGHPSFYFDMTPRRIAKLSFRSFPAVFVADIIQLHYARSFLSPVVEVTHFGQRNPSVLTADLPVLKSMGKRIVFHFHGCDVRYYEPGMDYPLNACEHCYREQAGRRKRELMSRLRGFADKFVVTTPDLLRFVPEAAYVPTALRIEEWQFTPPRKHDLPLRIVHAPSRPFGIKGTDHVLKALRPLIKAGKATLSLVQNMSRRQVLDTCRQADIAIDQLLVGWYGVFAQEMMALGKPVICYIDPRLNHFQRELPLINASPKTLSSAVEELLMDEQLRSRKGFEGRGFVERVHSSRVIAARLINLYNSL